MLDHEPRNPYLVDATDPSVRERLDRLYQRLSITLPGFPSFNCGTTSRAIEVMGFDVIYGRFRGLLGRIVDLTLAQFNPCLQEPVPTGVLVIEPNSPLFERYKYLTEPINETELRKHLDAIYLTRMLPNAYSIAEDKGKVGLKEITLGNPKHQIL